MPRAAPSCEGPPTALGRRGASGEGAGALGEKAPRTSEFKRMTRGAQGLFPRAYPSAAFPSVVKTLWAVNQRGSVSETAVNEEMFLLF